MWTDYLRALLADNPDAFKAELIDVLELWAERVWRKASR